MYAWWYESNYVWWYEGNHVWCYMKSTEVVDFIYSPNALNYHFSRKRPNNN